MSDVVDRLDAFLHEFGFVRIAARREALRLYAEPGWEDWGRDRLDVAGEQLVYRWVGIEVGRIDGLVGPQMEYAREAYAHWREHGEIPAWRDAGTSFVERNDDPVLPESTPFPRQRDMGAFFGRPGAAVRARLVHVACPWELAIAWNASETTRRIRVHERVADSLAEVLERIHEHYGPREIRRLHLDQYGGAYNHRRMRGGSSWSTHAYGAAIDWDPARNALHTRRPQAILSGAVYEDFWRIWEAAGWTSLGRARNFDWMHVQAAAL